MTSTSFRTDVPIGYSDADLQTDALRRLRAERAAQAVLAREDAHRDAAADFRAAQIRRGMREKEASASRGDAHTARMQMIKGLDPAYVERGPVQLRQDAAPQPLSGAAAARARMVSRLHRGS
jgi:hypothetical protein